MLKIHEPNRNESRDPVVITGIGLVTSVGADRESTWQAICRGTSGVRPVAAALELRGAAQRPF